MHTLGRATSRTLLTRYFLLPILSILACFLVRRRHLMGGFTKWRMVIDPEQTSTTYLGVQATLAFADQEWNRTCSSLRQEGFDCLSLHKHAGSGLKTLLLW